MSVVALSRAYPAREGAPVLRAADTEIFRFRYFTHCMACGFCHDQCCSHGVDIDAGNARALKALGPDFAQLIGVAQDEWFTAKVVADSEFPSGAHLRTRVVDGACVFHSRAGRGCLIHAYCAQSGIDYHALKPMVSILFPLTFENGVLEPSSEVTDGSLVCAGQGPAIYDGIRAELAYFFGEVLVAELDRIRAAQTL